MSNPEIIFICSALVLIGALALRLSKKKQDNYTSHRISDYRDPLSTRGQIEAELDLVFKDSEYKFLITDRVHLHSGVYQPHVEVYRFIDGIKFSESNLLMFEDDLKNLPIIKHRLDLRVSSYYEDLEVKQLRETMIKEWEQHPYCLSPKKQEQLRLAKEQVEKFNQKYRPYDPVEDQIAPPLASRIL